MFDIIIKNGTIIDGSGSKAKSNDIAIKDERIVAIDKIENAEAKNIIDATGYIITPGFIDIHTHTNFSIRVDNRSESQIRQGVTTEVTGLCGWSDAPCSNELRKDIIHSLNQDKGTWKTFSEYLIALEQCKPATNLACLVGHGTLRTLAMPKSSRTLFSTQEQIKHMRKMLRESLEQGAFGMSSGLEHFPGKGASLYELESLCSILPNFDALHASHIRNRDTYVINALSEVLEIARNTKSRLQIAHINPKYGCAPNTANHMLQLISWMRDEGTQVGMDIIPSIWNHSTIAALLPSWFHELSINERIALLKDSTKNASLRINHSPFMQLHIHEKWHKIHILSAKETKRHLGKTIAAIAKEYNCDAWDAIFSLLLEESQDMRALHFAGQCFAFEDLVEILKDPFCSICSDTASSAVDGPLQDFLYAPNTFEWTITFLQSFILEHNMLSLEEGIRRLTSLPADQAKIKERGLIAKNYYADLIIMNIDKLGTDKIVEKYDMYPKGIQTVIVNGKIALDKGMRVNKHNGKILRRV